MCLESLGSEDFFINTQAISGPNLMFYGITIGLPRSVWDARIIKSTAAFAKAERGEILVALKDAIQYVRVVS